MYIKDVAGVNLHLCTNLLPRPPTGSNFTSKPFKVPLNKQLSKNVKKTEIFKSHLVL